MQIHLVPPSVWQPELARAVDAFSGQTRAADRVRLTQAVLWTLQDAHIGITPALAAQLASLIVQPRARESGAWSSVLRSLQNTVSASGAAGIAVMANPVYFVLKIVRPLVREATGRIEESHLLCADEIASPVTADRYRRYGLDLEQELTRGTGTEERNRLFYLQHGAVMSAFSAATGGAATRSRMPELDQLGLAMLFALPSEIPADAWHPRHAPKPVFVRRNRPSPGAHEAQNEGIRPGRGEADLDEMIPSEYLNLAEPQVFLERVVSSGYFIFERLPRLEKLRDALVVGIMPPEVRGGGGSFVKACWADCMARLGRRLAEAGLRETEFRWIESDAAGRVRQCSFFLRDLPEAALTARSHDAFRWEFFTALRWLPDFFDEHAAAPPDRPGSRSDDLRTWVGRAWGAQSDHPRWSSSPLADGALGSRFSFVHVMVCVPSQQPGAEASRAGAKLLGALRARLWLGYRKGHSISVTHTPVGPAGRSWGFGSAREPYRAFAAGSRRERERLARELESAWLTLLTREIWHG